MKREDIIKILYNHTNTGGYKLVGEDSFEMVADEILESITKPPQSAEEFYNKRAFKHQLKRAIKHDYKYFESVIIELMEAYTNQQKVVSDEKKVCTHLKFEILGCPYDNQECEKCDYFKLKNKQI